jgi:DNA mismatch repair protein MutL
LGFEIDDFGEQTFALRAVPADLYGLSEKAFFLEILDELGALSPAQVRQAAERALASAACKAAVKGNMSMSKEELVALIDELITLENPYLCPHGRPTMITMSKREVERKFKRV